MARRIKRFFVFMFFSLFFTMSSKKIQTTNTSPQGVNSKISRINLPLSIGDNSAEAAGCRAECKIKRKCDDNGNCVYVGDGYELTCWGGC